MYTKEQLFTYISCVKDPELDFNLVELGLIYDACMDEGGKVVVTMTLSTKSCPLHQLILGWVKDALLKIKGIKEVEINLVWDPAWDISMASKEVIAKLSQ